VVISSYPEFVGGSTYRWMAVPLNAYLYGITNEDERPIYANGDIRNFLREKYRKERLSTIVPASSDGALPPGGWRTMLTMAFNRDIYGITLHTTPEEDRRFLEEFNTSRGDRKFSTWTNNCADFARKTINKYFPGSTRRDWINDFGITTPKAAARSLYKYGKDRPDRLMYISRFPQVQGPIWRSYDNRNFTEMAFKSKKYLLPALIFKPSVAAIFAGTYLLTGRFDIYKAYTEYPTLSMAKLRTRRDLANDPRISYFVPPDAQPTEERIRAEREAVLGDTGTWMSYKAMLQPVIKDVIARGLFQDEKEIKTFFRDLELESEPALDSNGHLILKVKYYGTDRVLGITRENLLAASSDRELALKLIIARLSADLNAEKKNRGNYQDLLADWLIMRELTADSSAALKGIDKSRGRFVTNRPKDSGTRKLEKLVIAITH
jgi:hypothetical protein